MYSSKVRALSLALAAGLSFGVLQSASEARTIPGSIGREANPADHNCFSLSNSSITNNCTVVKRMDFPLVVDSFGTLTARVRAQGATAANNVVCELFGWDGNSIGGSGAFALPAFGSPQLITMTNNVLFTNDSVFIGCDIFPRGTVHTLIY